MIKFIKLSIINYQLSIYCTTFASANLWRGARVVEEARLESVAYVIGIATDCGCPGHT